MKAVLGIFLSPRAQEKVRAWNFSKSQSPYKSREFGTFLSPKAHVDMGVSNLIY